MMNDATPIRAPQGALGWSPDGGWLYEQTELATSVDAGHMTLVVSDDGQLRGVTPHDRAPLHAVLRLDADLAEVVQRLGELGDRAEGLDTSTAVELAMLRGRVRKLEERSR